MRKGCFQGDTRAFFGQHRINPATRCETPSRLVFPG